MEILQLLHLIIYIYNDLDKIKDEGLQVIAQDSGTGSVTIGQYSNRCFLIMFNGKFENVPIVSAQITKSSIGYNTITVNSVYKYGFEINISHNATGTDTVYYQWQAVLE